MTLRRAVSLSTAIHLLGYGALAVVCARQPASGALTLSLEALANEPPLDLDEPLDVDVVAAQPVAELEPPNLREGDGTRSADRDEAPSHFAGREQHAIAPAEGEGPGVRERQDWTGRRDAQTLHTQLMNATEGYQPQRIRTAPRAASIEPVRRTPHPGTAAALASLDGQGDGRHLGNTGGVGPGSALPEGDGPRPGDGTRVAKDGDEAVGQARPLIPQGPAAAAAEREEPRPADDADSRLRSDDPHPHALAGIELSRAASPGSGSQSGGPGARPGFASQPQRGSAALPAGDPGAPAGEELWLRTADRRYVGYFARVYERVRSQWVFPRKLARELLQGEVVVSFTIRKDGRVDDIAVKKSSGFREFDDNVVKAVERAGPMPPVPAALGAKDLRVNAPFEYLNPLVR